MNLYRPAEFGVSLAEERSTAASSSPMRRRCPATGHAPAKVIPAIEALVGNVLDPIVADAGCRGHAA